MWSREMIPRGGDILGFQLESAIHSEGFGLATKLECLKE